MTCLFSMKSELGSKIKHKTKRKFCFKRNLTSSGAIFYTQKFNTIVQFNRLLGKAFLIQHHFNVCLALLQKCLLRYFLFGLVLIIQQQSPINPLIFSLSCHPFIHCQAQTWVEPVTSLKNPPAL